MGGSDLGPVVIKEDNLWNPNAVWGLKGSDVSCEFPDIEGSYVGKGALVCSNYAQNIQRWGDEALCRPLTLNGSGNQSEVIIFIL